MEIAEHGTIALYSHDVNWGWGLFVPAIGYLCPTSCKIDEDPVDNRALKGEFKIFRMFSFIKILSSDKDEGGRYE